MGLSSAAGYWMGQAIGKQDLREAKAFFRISTLMAIGLALTASVLTQTFIG